MFKKICLTIACTLTLAACDMTKVVWAPDAKRAAIIGSDGLRISDEKGTLSKPVMDQVAKIAWWPDSKQCLVLRSIPAKDWTEIEPILSPDEAKQVRESSEKLFTEISNFKGTQDELNKKLENDETIEKNLKAEAVAYLDFTHKKELAEKIPDWNNLPKAQSYIQVLEKYSAAQDKLSEPVLIRKTMNEIENIGVSPAGNKVSFVENIGTDALYVAAADGSNGHIISGDCNKYPCWSRDGKFIYFIESDGPTKGFRSATISSANVNVAQPDKSRRAEAAVSFDASDVVQVNASGDIIFSNRKVNFPSVDAPMNLELFIKRKGKNDLEMLTDGDLQKLDVQSFSVSPNGSKIALCSKSGATHILTVENKKVQTVLAQENAAGVKFTPNWRSENQLCLAVKSKRPGARNDDAELALINIDDKSIKILSTDWPISCTNDFLVEKSKN
ncbi:hypothetical protein KA183_01030 [bacterium]|nr:hypothetical protein [bacterium]